MNATPSVERVRPLRLAPAVPRIAPLIKARDLSIAFDGNRVLRDVCLDICDGYITALIGPSGCGKTSFLHCLNRLIDLVPSSSVRGSIDVGPWPILEPDTNVQALRRTIGIVFQKPNPFPFSIRRNLAIPLVELGVTDRADQERRMADCLKQVGLWKEIEGRLDDSALALSGGQQQRLCIARALLMEPKALLLDEPCSALDPMATTIIETLLLSLSQSYTIVIVTHNLAQARRIADYTALFWVDEVSGFLLEQNWTKTLFERPVEDMTARYVGGAIA
ncbi:MAG: phosphate ABC transporter ATP-binding protein [Geminicoccaceae bacterium]